MFLHTDLLMGAYSGYKQTYQHYPLVIATIWRALFHSQNDPSVVPYSPDFGHNPITKGSLSILMKKKKNSENLQGLYYGPNYILHGQVLMFSVSEFRNQVL